MTNKDIKISLDYIASMASDIKDILKYDYEISEKLTEVEYCSNIENEVEKIIKVLEQQPKKGKWIEREDNTSFVHQIPRIWIECSCCGWSFDRGYKNRFLYCPKCGADMRESDSE